MVEAPPVPDGRTHKALWRGYTEVTSIIPGPEETRGSRLDQLENRGYFLGLRGREVGASLQWVPSGLWGDKQDTFQNIGCHSGRLGLGATQVWCDQSGPIHSDPGPQGNVMHDL